MTRWLAAVAVVLGGAAAGRADVIHLKSGSPTEGTVLRVEGGKVRVQMMFNGTRGETAFALDQVARIEFASKFSTDGLSANPTNRLQQLDAEWARRAPLLGVPESDAGDVGLLRAQTLADLGRPAEALKFIETVEVGDWNAARRPRGATLKIRCLAALGKLDEAMQVAETLEGEANDPGAVAFVQMALGEVQLAKTNHWRALDHFMHPRVFSPGLAETAAEGLWKASACWVALGRTNDAVLALRDLTEDYPSSKVAGLARTRLTELTAARKSPAAAPGPP